MTEKRIKIIACEVMKDEIKSILPPHGTDIEFINMGYHLYPQKLRHELQNIINRSRGYERIVLAFGLCGGAAHGLKSDDSILTIPRTHDCISFFLCEENRHVYTYEKEMGVFYLTTGWMIAEKSIISDYIRLKEKYGEEKAENLFHRMYDSYQMILFIKTGCPDEQQSIEDSRRIATLLNANHEIIENRSPFFRKIAAGPWNDKEFIHAMPGESISEDAFMVNVR